MVDEKLKVYMEAEGITSFAFVGFRGDGAVVVEAEATIDEIMRASAFLVRSTMDVMPPTHFDINLREVTN